MQLGEGLQLRSIWRKHPRIILSVILMPVAQRTNLPFSHLRRPIILLLPPSCEFLLCTRHQFADKGPHSQSYDFSSSHVQMWELEQRRLSTKELMFLDCGAGENSWESLGYPGDQKQSILKEINSEYSLEVLILKLKLQYFGHLLQRANSLEKTLMLGKIESRRGRGQQRMRWLDGITDWMDMS